MSSVMDDLIPDKHTGSSREGSGNVRDVRLRIHCDGQYRVCNQHANADLAPGHGGGAVPVLTLRSRRALKHAAFETFHGELGGVGDGHHRHHASLYRVADHQVGGLGDATGHVQADYQQVTLKAGDDKTVDFDMTREEYMKTLTPEQRKQIEEYKAKNSAATSANKVIAGLKMEVTEVRAKLADAQKQSIKALIDRLQSKQDINK